MKKHATITTLSAFAALLAVFLSGCMTGLKSNAPPTLKNAYKNHF